MQGVFVLVRGEALVIPLTTQWQRAKIGHRAGVPGQVIFSPKPTDPRPNPSILDPLPLLVAVSPASALALFPEAEPEALPDAV